MNNVSSKKNLKGLMMVKIEISDSGHFYPFLLSKILDFRYKIGEVAIALLR